MSENKTASYPYCRPMRQDITSAVLGLLCVIGFVSGWAGPSDKPIYMLWVASLSVAAISFYRLVMRFVKPPQLEVTADGLVIPGAFGSKKQIAFADIESVADRKNPRTSSHVLMIKANGTFSVVMSVWLDDADYNAIVKTVESHRRISYEDLFGKPI